MNVVFCGLMPPDLPPGHRAVQCSSVNELNGRADITVVLDSVPGWQDVRITGRSYLVSDDLSLEIIEAAEAAGYAGVWMLPELPVRLAALLRAGETGEVRQLRRPLERITDVPGDVQPPQSRGVNRDGFYGGDGHQPVRWPEPDRHRKSTRFRENAPGDDLQVIPQQYVPRQIISFNSTGGGKGKSVLTAATAVMLATDPRFHASVVAVDLDPYAGTLARKLGVSPRFSILDWINGAVDDITRCLTSVHLPGANGNSRLMVLSGPEREEDGAAITAEVAQNLLSTLQRRFDIVLVDTRPEMMDATLVALENAQHIFLIDVPDVTSLRNTMKRAHILADLGMLHKLHMVLNRVPKLSVMRMDVVDEIPSATEVIVIPEDIGVQVAVNRLEPVGLSRRTKKFTRAMSGILKQIRPKLRRAQEEYRAVLQLLPQEGCLLNNSMSLLRKRLMEKGATVATTGTLGEREKAEIRQKVLLKTDSIDRKFFAEFENRDTSYERREQIKESVYRIIYGYVREAAANLPGVVDPALAELAREITDEVLGFGIIQVLLDDQNVTEIMIVGPKIWIEKDGIKFRYVRDFQTIEQIYLLIERILAPLPGRRVDEASPIVDARLPDKSRVNIVVRPVAVNGLFVTIRKFKRHMNIHELIKRGTLSHRVAGLCKALIRAGFHIIISGNTGSGKTTTANALSGFIPKWHRIVTIEDAVELQLQQEHVLVHESRPPNIAGEGEITIRYLVKNALREYPDWIIVGEVRDAEVVDMLQAANTGHKIITTIHADSPAELPSRIEGMFQRAFTSGVSSSFVAKSIVDGLDLVIHQDRLEETVRGSETVIDFDNWDGEESEEEDAPRVVKRRITHITGIIGCQGESVIMQDILRYDRDRDALVVAPGWEKCIPLFQKHRLTFPDWFREGVVL